ncbi:peptidase M16 [Spirochaetia bacterium]|nr:peptidase M16 [Spirochaetia bacterium]
MKTALVKGQVLDSGFEILDIVDLAELEAVGIWARHQKSKAEVFHVLNDDKENLFGFGFSTATKDSTGVAHILEHSVLCGSQNYPLKDAFLIMEQGSLQTYLNAWTFPDKTVYPSSSVNEHDYFNLMGVYGDAVFRPLLSEWTFMQEGHRLALPSAASSGKTKKPEDSKHAEGPHITGVVYNEMKGAYSSLDTYAGLWSVKAVLPDTPYAFESGGDPECIPDLTWEDLREFHRQRYSPANCRIFLAGNIPTEKQLSYLNEKFFSSLEAGQAADPVALAERWDAPRSFQVPCPAGGDSKSTVFLSWLCTGAENTDEVIALGALTEALLGHDGSPLTRTLIESGLGEDLSPASGLESEIRELLFVAGLRGVEKGNAAKVEELIFSELRRLVKEGIPREEIDAALLSMEFAHREIRRSNGPFSLVWLRRSFTGWIHGARPWDKLLFVPGLNKIKERIAADQAAKRPPSGRYFESLIQKYFLDNPHRALVTIEPEADYLEKQEKQLAEKLAKKAAALSETEKHTIQEKAEALDTYQSERDGPAALAAIPHLSRKDLSAEIERIPRSLHDAGGVPLVAHELFTNGITYADLAFPVDILPPADYPWLPFFTRAAVSVGLPGMDYGEVSGLLARTAGGFHGMLRSSSMAPGAGSSIPTPSGIFDLGGRDWLIYRLKALDEKTGPALDLALRLITEADFSDQRRIRDLVLEMKNQADSSLAPAGHSYASTRSARYFSRSSTVDEIWNGLGQIGFAHYLADLDSAEIIRRLGAIRDTLAGKGGLIANFTGSAEALASYRSLASSPFRRFGPPRPRNPASVEAASFYPFLDAAALGRLSASDSAAAPDAVLSSVPTAEVFASPSLQIGFAAMTLSSAPFNAPEQAAELVLAHQLSTGALWEDIRMKGGAYGAFAHTDSLEGIFALSTYRDPKPSRSLESFSSILDSLAKQGSDAGGIDGGKELWYRNEDLLEKAIIGSYSRETRPRTSAEKGSVDFSRFLYGIEDLVRQRKLEKLIQVSGDEIAAVLRRLASQKASSPGVSSPVIVAGTAAAEKAAKALGVTPQMLPA